MQARARLEELYPQDNAVLSDTRLGAMWYQKLVAYRFAVEESPESLDQIARYEGIMETVSERTGASRAAMKRSFRTGIRTIVAEHVKREFNRVSFVASGGGGPLTVY